MKAYYETKQSNPFNWRKFNLFVFFVLQVFLLEACQFKATQLDVISSDQIRNHQAEQILKDRIETNPIDEFNGDMMFSRYLAIYVEGKNNSLDSLRFVSSLMRISRELAYDPVFLLAVIKTESSFNQNAIGSVGEVGLMQIRPETAEWICMKHNLVWRGANALKEPEYNILVGSHYFKYLRKTLRAESLKYITAYNMGIGNLKKRSETEIKEHHYFNRVVENYLQIYSELKRIKSDLKV